MGRNITAYFIYAIICLLFFLQFPLNNSLTGNVDTIANLAMFKHLKMQIDCFFGLREFVPDFLYPVKNAWMLFGADFGSGLIHVFFNYLGFDDMWANYLYISLLFSLNSFTLFLLLSYIINGGYVVTLFLSLLFSFSHFTLANLENPNVLVFFPSFLSILYVLKFIKTSKTKYLYISILISGIQIYLSPTNFLMHVIIIISLLFFYQSKLNVIDRIKNCFIYLFFLTFLVSPYVWFYIINYPGVDIERVSIIHLLSLNLDDFFRVLPGHLYLESNTDELNQWTLKIKSAFLGFVFFALLLVSLFRVKKNIVWKILFFIGIFISIGPIIYLNNKPIIPNITYPLFSLIDIGRYITVPSRYFFISIFSGVVLIGVFISTIKSSSYRKIVTILLLLSLVENVPFKMEKYSNEFSLNILPDKELVEILKKSPHENILFYSNFDNQLSEIRQEYIYMYWQYYINKNIFNGHIAVLTEDVLRLNNITRNLTYNNLNILIKEYNLNALVVFKNSNDFNEIYSIATGENGLMSKYFENENFVIFEKKV